MVPSSGTSSSGKPLAGRPGGVSGSVGTGVGAVPGAGLAGTGVPEPLQAASTNMTIKKTPSVLRISLFISLFYHGCSRCAGALGQCLDIVERVPAISFGQRLFPT